MAKLCIFSSRTIIKTLSHFLPINLVAHSKNEMINFSGGESSFELDPVISFGTITSSVHVDANGKFETGPVPFRTIVMLISLTSHILISSLTHYLFVEEKIPREFDIFKCFRIR